MLPCSLFSRFDTSASFLCHLSLFVFTFFPCQDVDIFEVTDDAEHEQKFQIDENLHQISIQL